MLIVITMLSVTLISMMATELFLTWREDERWKQMFNPYPRKEDDDKDNNKDQR